MENPEVLEALDRVLDDIDEFSDKHPDLLLPEVSRTIFKDELYLKVVCSVLINQAEADAFLYIAAMFAIMAFNAGVKAGKTYEELTGDHNDSR